MIFLDTSAIYALADKADPNHVTAYGRFADALKSGEAFLLHNYILLESAALLTREAGLLRALVEREGQAITRGELLEEVWGLRPDTRTRVVENFIVRLRRYVEPDPSRPRHILSVRGHGYRLVR